MRIPTPHDAIRQRPREQIYAGNDSYDLVVVVHNAEEAETKGAEEAVGSLRLIEIRKTTSNREKINQRTTISPLQPTWIEAVSLMV